MRPEGDDRYRPTSVGRSLEDGTVSAMHAVEASDRDGAFAGRKLF
jgi:hypothetical protein